ncbi:MAG: hypothetical protein EHM20_05050, partial [Alphaproteobacteria bacterium]
MIRSRSLITLLAAGIILSTFHTCLADTSVDLNQTKQNVILLIDSGDYAKASTAIDSFISNYSNDSNLINSLYQFTDRYEWSCDFNEAQRVFQQIIKNYPGTSDEAKAKLGIARTNVMSLITSKDFVKAKAALNELLITFDDNPGLAETIFWIGDKYIWFERFQDANQIFQQILQKYPNSPWAAKTRLTSSRAEILCLIMQQKFNNAQQAAEKLKTDFATNPDLPETLFNIADKFEWWSKYQEATALYQYVTQNYPGILWAKKAKLANYRAEIISHIRTDEFDKADEEFQVMMTDFNSDPNLPQTVYWIGEKYKWSDKAEKSSQIYQLIMQKYPDTKWANKAALGISRMDALSFSMAQDYDKAQLAIDKLNSDSNNTDLPEALYWLAQKNQWAFKFADANKIYNEIIQKYPNSTWADISKFDIAASNVLSLVISGEPNLAEYYLDKLKSDFAGNSSLPRIIMVIGE